MSNNLQKFLVKSPQLFYLCCLEKEVKKPCSVIIPGINFTPASLPIAPSFYKEEHLLFFFFFSFHVQLTTPVCSSLNLLKHETKL